MKEAHAVVQLLFLMSLHFLRRTAAVAILQKRRGN
jgi:hypothetical protein